jgi:hypothetical protein
MDNFANLREVFEPFHPIQQITRMEKNICLDLNRDTTNALTLVNYVPSKAVLHFMIALLAHDRITANSYIILQVSSHIIEPCLVQKVVLKPQLSLT